MNFLNFFLIDIVECGVKLGPFGTAATNRPILPAPGDYDTEEIGGMIGRENRSTRRKPAPVPFCPPQTPYACPDANPGRRCGKPVTNRLSYGTANFLNIAKGSRGGKLNVCTAFCHRGCTLVTLLDLYRRM
jgi:hypothetical protein